MNAHSTLHIRPCIDLKDGRVVQIVGGSLKSSTSGSDTSTVNFTTDRPAALYADQYRADGLTGGHVIALGQGNEEAALSALSAFPGGMHYGGGVNPENAMRFLKAGASHVIVTSYVFREGQLDQERLDAMVQTVGKDRLVLDLSCRHRDGDYYVTTDRWQRFTDLRVNPETLEHLAAFCDEFLVHAVDVEGKRSGVDATLIGLLAESAPIPVTYAGGVGGWADIDLVQSTGKGRVDLTIGSALDLFGGTLPYHEVVSWQHANHPG